ncbi:MAG: serine hydrolase [Pseudomonadota bacterium]|nr:serine hydrolase [Pseudomonadota bacterium]
MKFRQMAGMIAAFAVLAGTPALAREDGWQTATPQAHGLDPAPLDAMVAEIRSEADIGISAVLLVHRGELVHETYFGEWGPDDLHNMRSASKTVTSALVGIAIDHGFIPSAEATVLDYFPEYEGEIANWDEAKRDITLAHILTMTSGVRGNEDAMYPTDDWIKFYFDQPLAHPPGEVFSYATSGVVTLGNVITRASGQRIPAFADAYLFGPLGITEYRWPITNSRGSQGLAMTGGGLSLRPRDMARFGQLYLDRGVWNGERILSEDWIAASVAPHAVSDLHGEDFGYLWRMRDWDVADRQVRSWEAWGNGGQFIMIFPDLELVAVFTGENYGRWPEMERPFALMEDYVLPVFAGQ